MMYKDGEVAESGKDFKTGISFLLRLAVDFTEKCENFEQHQLTQLFKARVNVHVK